MFGGEGGIALRSLRGELPNNTMHALRAVHFSFSGFRSSKLGSAENEKCPVGGIVLFGGEGGIRTLGTVTRTTV